MGYSFQPDDALERSISLPRVDIQSVMRLVYVWMGLGLLITAVVAYFTATNEAILNVALNPAVMFGSIIASFAMVIAISAGMSRKWLSPTMAMLLFFAYAAILGFTLSVILLVYEVGAIYMAFASTAVIFGVMTVFGYTTKMDLTKWGTYLIMGLIGVIVVSLLNIFLFRSSGFDLLISIAGVVIFTGLTAYDTQKIKTMAESYEVQGDSNLAMKLSVYGALSLYLDFINLFLFLLRIFGGGRD